MEGNIGSADTIITVPQNQSQGRGIAARYGARQNSLTISQINVL
jgi:hypothetical protein